MRTPARTREAHIRAIRRKRQRQDFIVRLGILVVLMLILVMLTALVIKTAEKSKPEGGTLSYAQAYTQELPTSPTGSDTATGASTGPGNSEFTEYRQADPVQTSRGLTFLSSRTGDWGMANDYSSLFDTIGQEYKITAYTAGYESTGKNPGDPGYGITYSGKTVTEKHTIAADLTQLPLGTKVLIEGIDAVFVVEDKGGAVKGKHIDLYIPSLSEALDWGVQYRRIIILEMGGNNNG